MFRFRPTLMTLETRETPSGIDPIDPILQTPPQPGDLGYTGDPGLTGPIDSTGGGGIDLLPPL
jgi:hypothetical protein